MHKKALWAISFLTLLIGCNPSNKTNTEKKDSVVQQEPVIFKANNELEEVIQTFITAYASKNDTLVNSVINPELGISVIYRPGVADTFTKADSLSFSNPIPKHWVYPDVQNTFNLKYELLPEFDCGSEKWNKVGLYIDTLVRPNQLSQIIDFENEYEFGKHTPSFREDVRKAESESYRVILTGDEPLIFHIRKYNGTWYVVLLDRAYAGCDA